MTTEQQGLRAGHLLALVGAIATVGSLWRPWYAVDVPQALRDALKSEGARAAEGGSALGAFVQGMAAALPSRVEAGGWEALRGADVALCLSAIVVIALVLAVAGAFGSAVRVDRAAAGRWIGLVALVALAVAVVHVLDRPGAGVGIDVQLGDGVWLAAAGTLAMAVGGALAGSPDPPAPAPARTFVAPTLAAEDDAARALTSIAPPGA